MTGIGRSRAVAGVGWGAQSREAKRVVGSVGRVNDRDDVDRLGPGSRSGVTSDAVVRAVKS